MAALAAADLAKAHVPPRLVSLKWPNDLLLAGRKAGGILVESGQAAAGGLWVAVGIGINLAQAPDALSPDGSPATDFARAMTVSPPSPEAALAELAEALARWRAIWDQSGFAPIAAAWADTAHGLGAPCTARLPRETLQGTARGLDQDGALRLELADGTVRRITAGDVFF